MEDNRVGMRYLGGWGGDFEAEVSSTAMPEQSLGVILKRLRQRNQKEREKIYKRIHLLYDDIAEGLIAEEELDAFKENDSYMKRIKNDLGL